MDVFKNGSLGYLAGFLILVFLIIARILLISTSNKSSLSIDSDPDWVAVGDGSNGYGNIMYSSDGKEWTKTSIGDSFVESEPGYDVAYGTCNGISLWVVVGKENSGGHESIMYSSDGKEWTKTFIGDSFASSGKGVAYGTSSDGNPLWVAVGEDGTSYGNIMYSSDGQSWTKTSTGDSFGRTGFGIAYGTSNGTSPLWVAVGNDGSSGYGNIMYSEDGQNWTKTSTGDSFASSGNNTAYGTSDGNSSIWVAVGYDSGYGNIMYSSDGKTWTATHKGDSFSNVGRGVAYGTSDGTSPLWVAVGEDTDGIGGYGNIMFSSNGKEWTKTSSGDSFSIQGLRVAYGTSDGTSPLWVAVGSDSTGYGNIMYSSNGKTWTKTSAGDSFRFFSKGVAAKHLLYGMDKNYYHPY